MEKALVYRSRRNSASKGAEDLQIEAQEPEIPAFGSTAHLKQIMAKHRRRAAESTRARKIRHFFSPSSVLQEQEEARKGNNDGNESDSYSSYDSDEEDMNSVGLSDFVLRNSDLSSQTQYSLIPIVRKKYRELVAEKKNPSEFVARWDGEKVIMSPLEKVRVVSSEKPAEGGM